MNAQYAHSFQAGRFLNKFVLLLALSILIGVAFWLSQSNGKKIPSIDELKNKAVSPLDISDDPSPDSKKETAEKESQDAPETNKELQPLNQRRAVLGKSELAAFPGAQGDGAHSRGGRGGKVLIVDRLDDPCPTKACTTEDLADPAKSTPGTLRWALLQNYPRTVVFQVSGIISLQEDIIEKVGEKLHTKRLAAIRIKSPYLTIAGQSAPAGGVTVANNGISILTHDVTMRYLRFRTGRGTREVFSGQQNPQTLMIENGAERVIIDHCSFSWMPAEGVSVYNGELWDGSKGSAKDITLSWNVIGEGLIRHKDGRGHPNAAFMSGFNGDEKYAARNVTLHHNLLLHSQKRNADILTHNARLVNNLIYNWQWLPTVLAGGVQADVIGNIWKPGPLSQAISQGGVGIHLVPAASDLKGRDPLGWWHAVSGEPSLYLSGNAFGDMKNIIEEGKGLLCYYRKRDAGCQNELIKPDWLRSEAMDSSKYPVEIDSVAEAEEQILKQAGVSQRINFKGAWVTNRDPVDERYVAEYTEVTYSYDNFPWHEKEVGGYPVQIEGSAAPDKDEDGMSDIWELKHGLNPADPKDAHTVPKGGAGYTHLEMFLNGVEWSS